jgi:hypothetical protein
VKLVYTAGVRTGVQVFAICVKTGIIFKMRNTFLFFIFIFSVSVQHLRHQFIHLFDNISEGDINGFGFQHNSEVYKFISAAVDLFDLFICWVG